MQEMSLRPEDYFPHGRRRITDPHAVYFLTMTCREWADVFTRGACRRIVVDGLRYCQRKKGLIIYAYVIMSNHLHLLVRADPTSDGIPAFVRDFKRHTASRIRTWLEASDTEYRKLWLLRLLREPPNAKHADYTFSLWQPGSHPVLCHSRKFLVQKLNYIHRNPVKAGIVHQPEDYMLSSARQYAGRPGGKIRVTVLEI